MDYQNFGQWLKHEREKRGMTQTVLAERAGTTSATLSRIEAGSRGHSRRLVIEIANALSADVNSALIAGGFTPMSEPMPPQHLVKNLRDLAAQIETGVSHELTREYDPSDEPVIHSYTGLKPTNKEAVKAIIEHFAELEKRESIGGTVATD